MRSLTVTARFTPELRAVLADARPLTYASPVPVADLPAHVRAASAIRRQGARTVIVQDDVNAFAVLDLPGGATRPVLLPAGAGGARVFDDVRGNKKRKMDLEACAALPDGRLVAFGSGSSPVRERIAVLDPQGDGTEVIEPTEMYRCLRALASSRGAALNIEGAAVLGRHLWLAQRGHGRHAATPWNALIGFDLDMLLDVLAARVTIPLVRSIIDIDLGVAATGIAFGFTDVATTVDGRLAFLACAEDSTDALSDGPVDGCRFGWVDVAGQAIATDVLEADGRPTQSKLEGLEGRPGDDRAFDVVADMDRPDLAATISVLRVGRETTARTSGAPDRTAGG